MDFWYLITGCDWILKKGWELIPILFLIRRHDRAMLQPGYKSNWYESHSVWWTARRHWRRFNRSYPLFKLWDDRTASPAIETLLSQQKYNLSVSDTSYDSINQIIQLSDTDRVVTNLWRSPPGDQFVSDRFLEILLSEGLICESAIAAPQLYITRQEQQSA